MLQNKHVDELIESPQYVIGVTGHSTSRLDRRPSEPLPLSELLLYEDGDIRAWLLTNPGKDSVNYVVLKTRQGTEVVRAGTPTPVCCRHEFCNPNVGHRIGSAGSLDDNIDQQKMPLRQIPRCCVLIHPTLNLRPLCSLCPLRPVRPELPGNARSNSMCAEFPCHASSHPMPPGRAATFFVSGGWLPYSRVLNTCRLPPFEVTSIC